MNHLQIKALKNAKSVEGYIFTKETQAHNQCIVSNTKMMLDAIAKLLQVKIS
jgi:hypothetical protein